MSAERPSLTPHRDQVERMQAGFKAAGPPIGWQGVLFRDLSHAIHLVIADARDRGVDETELRLIAPKLMWIASKQICGAFGMSDDNRALMLLGAACSERSQIDPTRKAVERLPNNHGGRA